jgi:hypothetical protein
MIGLVACSNNAVNQGDIAPTISANGSTTPTGETFIPSNTEDILIKVYGEDITNTNVMIWKIPVDRSDLLDMYLGLSSTKDIVEVSMMSSSDEKTPFGAALVAVKDNHAAIELAKTLKTVAPTTRWEGYNADDVASVAVGNYVFVVMLDKTVIADCTSNDIIKAFEKVVSNQECDENVDATVIDQGESLGPTETQPSLTENSTVSEAESALEDVDMTTSTEQNNTVVEE